MMEEFDLPPVEVVGVRNEFYGNSVTVAACCRARTCAARC